jgi:hypothetical protein
MILALLDTARAKAQNIIFVACLVTLSISGGCSGGMKLLRVLTG